LSIGEVMSLHPRKDTTRNRVCKHALALRARGVGSAWTTLHLRYEQEAAALLGIPEGICQAALLPVAYYTGEDFKPAKRVPAHERTY
jgi:hypothetical protein